MAKPTVTEQVAALTQISNDAKKMAKSLGALMSPLGESAVRRLRDEIGATTEALAIVGKRVEKASK